MNKLLKTMAMVLAVAGLGGCAQMPMLGGFLFGPPASTYQQNVILLCAQTRTGVKLSASSTSELAKLCATPPTTNPTPAQVDALAIVARAFGGGK